MLKRVADHIPLTKLDGLAAFLKRRGHTLLIKGEPGCGKTTLALRILDDFGEGNGIYISSRVSEAKLYTQISYADKLLGNGKFVDVRLDTLQSIIRRVLELRTDKGEVLVVLDTWDGLAKELDTDTRLKTEKTLIALADGSQARLVFVSEEPAKTTMDYLVDGIVELVRGEDRGRIVREILLHKLRGTSIDQHRYVFSLVGGKFNYVPPYSEPDYSASKRPKPKRDPTPNHYSFGSALDDVFGGIEKGSTVALEYEDNVPYSAIRLITLPLAINFLNLGRTCMYVPLLGANPKQLIDVIKPHVGRDAVEERFRIAVMSRGNEKPEPPLFYIQRKMVVDAHQDVSDAVAQLKQKSADGATLIVDSVNFLENMFSSNVELLVESLADRVITTQRNGDLTLFLINSKSRLLSQVLGMTHTHIKLWVKDRSIMMAAEKPVGDVHAIWPSGNPILPEYIKIV